MSKPPEIHLCIVRTKRQVRSLGVINKARYFRHQFRRLGAHISLTRNRLRRDSVPFIFAAHLGFDAAQCRRQFDRAPMVAAA